MFVLHSRVYCTNHNCVRFEQMRCSFKRFERHCAYVWWKNISVETELLFSLDLKATQCARFSRCVCTCNHAAVCERIISFRDSALASHDTNFRNWNLIIDVWHINVMSNLNIFLPLSDQYCRIGNWIIDCIFKTFILHIAIIFGSNLCCVIFFFFFSTKITHKWSACGVSLRAKDRRLLRSSAKQEQMLRALLD